MAVLNLTSIKNGIKTILDTANDVAADYDLSTGLNRRVQKVLTYSPLAIAPQASFYPFVTIEVNRKDVEHMGMAKNQAVAKRRADIFFNIYGIFWEQITSNVTKDPADDQVEKLMENIEVILRTDLRLNSTVDWSRPLDVNYHSGIDEDTHYRAGVMSFQASVYY